MSFSLALSTELGTNVRLVERRPGADSDPEQVVQELRDLRELLQQEEVRRDRLNTELMELQHQLQQTLLDEELMRERRGGVEPTQKPSLNKGVALIDGRTYASMLPEEQLEVNVFGFKMSCACTSSASTSQYPAREY